MITINLEKAKVIWKNKIAATREAEFLKNDIALRDAQLAEDQAAIDTCIERRDYLRSIGDLISNVSNIADLQKILP